MSESRHGKLTVTEYVGHSDFHKCTTEDGEIIRIDLLVSGSFPKGTTPESLIGKTFYANFHPYQYVANEVSTEIGAGGSEDGKA